MTFLSDPTEYRGCSLGSGRFNNHHLTVVEDEELTAELDDGLRQIEKDASSAAAYVCHFYII